MNQEPKRNSASRDETSASDADAHSRPERVDAIDAESLTGNSAATSEAHEAADESLPEADPSIKGPTSASTPAKQHAETCSFHHSPADTQPRGDATKRQAMPRTFGRYEIEKKLGEGGMGAVYLARDTKLERLVALKIPSFGKNEDPLVIERFMREARAAANLDHPNLCPVFDVGRIDGIHFLTMAYIDGRRLSEFIVPDKPLPTRQVAAVVRRIAIALGEAHDRGIVHRDLKPSNIMVNRRREPIVMDFGLAQRLHTGDSRLTQTGAIVGTPAYMSPEQITAGEQPVGPSSDIYSLGVILYEMLTGRLPFVGDPFSILSQILTADPAPPSSHRADLEPTLDEICMRAIARSLGERFGSMKEFADALRGFLQSEASVDSGGAAPPPVAPPVAPRAAEVGGGTSSATESMFAPLPPAVPEAVSVSQPPSVPSPHPGDSTLVHEFFRDVGGSSTSASKVSHGAMRSAGRGRSKIPAWAIPAMIGGGGLIVGLLVVLIIAAGGDGDSSSGPGTLASRDSSTGDSNDHGSNTTNSNAHPVEVESADLKVEEPSEPVAPPIDISSLTNRGTGDENSSNDVTGADDVGVAGTQPEPGARVDAGGEVDRPLTTASNGTSTANGNGVGEKSGNGGAAADPQDLVKNMSIAATPLLPDDPDSPITLDGRADDWNGIADAIDARDEAPDDPSRNIVRTAALHTKDSIYVLIETAGKPSTAPLAFWIDFDLDADPAPEMRIGMRPDLKHTLWVLPNDGKDQSQEVDGAAYFIRDVMEARIPWKTLQDALPVEMKGLLPTPAVPASLTVHVFSWLEATDARIDFSVPTASVARLDPDDLLAARRAAAEALGPLEYESIWVRDGQANWQMRHGISNDELTTAYASMSRRSMQPLCIRGYVGDDGKEQFAAVWGPAGGAKTIARHGLDRKTLDAEIGRNGAGGYRLVFIDAYGQGREVRFNAIWAEDAGAIAWKHTFSTGATVQRDFDTAIAQGFTIVGQTGWTDETQQTQYFQLFAKTSLRPGSLILPESEYRQRALNLGGPFLLVDAFRQRGNRYYMVMWIAAGANSPEWKLSRIFGSGNFDREATQLRQQGYRLTCMEVIR